jgi:hypothetical protein
MQRHAVATTTKSGAEKLHQLKTPPGRSRLGGLNYEPTKLKGIKPNTATIDVSARTEWRA